MSLSENQVPKKAKAGAFPEMQVARNRCLPKAMKYQLVTRTALPKVLQEDADGENDGICKGCALQYKMKLHVGDTIFTDLGFRGQYTERRAIAVINHMPRAGYELSGIVVLVAAWRWDCLIHPEKYGDWDRANFRGAYRAVAKKLGRRAKHAKRGLRSQHLEQIAACFVQYGMCARVSEVSALTRADIQVVDLLPEEVA
jgi:hypothetical protein